MKKQINKPEDVAILRHKAEELLQRKYKAPLSTPASEIDILKLIHELEVHQIELELQNEELLLAKEQQELASEKYVSLFDFAPSAYFTLTDSGKIAELNLAGAQMLGKERQKLINSRLAFFMSSSSRVVFDDFLSQVFSRSSPASCEVTFGTEEDSCINALLKGTLSDDGKHCLITAVDITERNKRELELRKTAELNYLLVSLFANAPALTDKQLYDEALDIAVKVTGSEIGFFHQVSDDQQEIILTTWNDEARKKCTTVYDNHYPIDKAGNWADCIRQKKPVVYNDYAGSPNRKGMPAGHAPVGRTMSVPVVHEEKVRLIFGVGNKTSDYTDSDVTFIQSIANELDKILGKRAIERNLQQIEDRWHFAIEGSNDGIWDWNVLTGDVYFSNRWKEMIGYNPDELEGKISEWMERVHAEDLPEVMETLQRHFNGESPQYFSEHRIRCKDGSYKWISDRGKVLEWTPESKPFRMVGTHTDITVRKQDEALLRIKEYDLKESQRIAHVGSWRLDLKTNEVLWTEELYNMYGFDPSVPPPPYTEHMKLFTHESWEKLSTALAHTRKTGIPYTLELETIRKDGTNGWMWVHGETEIDRAGKIVALWGAAQDITERKNSENEIQWRNDDLQLMNNIILAANNNKNLDSIIELISTQLRKSFSSHLISIFLPDVENRELRMYGNKLDNELLNKIEKLIGRAVPQIRLKMDDEHPFTEVERSLTGLLFVGKKAIINRLDGYLICTPWPTMVQKFVKKLLPLLCDIIDYQSSIAVPLISNGIIVGYLELGSRKILTDNDLNRIQAIANQFASVIARNESNKKLRDSEEIMSSAFNYASIGMAFVSPEGRWLKVNAAVAAMLGYTEAELMAKTFQEITHPDDLGKDLNYVRQMLEGTIQTYQMEKRYFHKSGSIIWVLLSVSLVNNELGHPLHFISQIQDITERELAESKLKESEEKYRQMADNSPSIIYRLLLKPELRFDYVSPSATKITGYTPEEYYADPQLGINLVHPDDRKLLEDTTKYYNGEPLVSRWIKKDGVVIWTEQRNVMMFNESNEPFAIEGQARDITESRIAEETIRKSEEKFRIVADNAFNWEFWEGTDGRWIHHSPSCKKITGYSADEFLNDNDLLLKIIHPDDREDYSNHHKHQLKDKESGQHYFRIITREGVLRYIEHVCQPVYNGENVFIGIRGTNIDITERKQAVDKLKESEEKYRSIFESVQEVYFEASMDGTLLEVSPSIEVITKGYLKRDELIGQSFPGIYENSGERDAYFSRLFELKRVNDYELRLRNKDGSIIPCAISSALSYDASGKPVKITGILRDITERKNAENALKETLEQLNQAKLNLEERVEERTKEILEISGMQKVILENAPIAVLTTNEEGIFQSINPAGEKMVGYSSDEIIGKLTPLFFHDKDELKNFCIQTTQIKNPTDEEIYGTALQDMFHKTTEWTWIRKNGEKFPVRIIHSSIVDGLGNLQGFMGIIIDITEEKLAIETLRESEERFHKMFKEHAAIMLLISPENGEILQANDTAGNYYGLDFAGNKTYIHEINTLSATSIKDEMEMAAKQHRNYFVFPHKLATGEIRTVEVHSTPIEVRGKKVLFSVIHDITERKLAEDALNKSEAENRAIIRAVPDLMFRISRDGTYLDCLSNNHTMLFVPQERFIGKTISQVLPPDLALQSMNAIEKASQNEDVASFEYSLAVNGKDSYFENRIIAIADDEVLSIIRDISERKEMETALKMQSAAFESFALAIIITDIKGRIQWANSAFTQLTGYSVDEAIGKKPGVLVKSGKYDKDFYKIFWDTLLNKEVWTGEMINRRKDGSLYYEEQTITPVLDSQGNISSFIAIKIDITERKKLFHQLADQRRRLADIIKGTNAGTWEWNIQTGETKFNEQWAKIIGYTLEEITPVSIETWMKFAHPDDLKTSGELLEKHFKGNLDYYSFESRMKHKNGEWIWVLDKGRVHEWDADGKPLLMSGIHLDITEQKRIETALQQAKNEAEKVNQAKSEFLSRMSHELRTPMNSILGFAQLLEMGDLNAKQKGGVHHIIRSGKHLLDLINEVLDISRIESGRLSISLEPVKVDYLVQEIIDITNPLASAREIKIIISQQENQNLFIKADRQRLKQVLINLINNAIKYNRDKGNVTIKTSLIPGSDKLNNRIRIAVSDTGLGISEKDIPKLFIPFERIGAEKTSTEGTGLGLAVVKKLMDAMGGNIGVESVIGEGSVFWIELPQVSSPTENAIQNGSLNTEEKLSESISGVILYVEDNVSNIELIEEVLVNQRNSIKLETVLKGNEALGKALECKPDLILLDLNLPDIHGSEVLEILQADDRTKKIPVVIVSADAMPNQLMKLLKSGARNYLTKPLDVKNFLRIVDQFLSKESPNS